jgi:protein-disulfide isomerase
MMRTLFASLALVSIAASAALPADAAPVRRAAPHRVVRPAVTDWTKMVVATPDGGYRVGNPNAQVKVVEFFSFTCPHCAAFASEGTPPLIQTYVSTGKVSFEIRSALRDAVDLVAALSARCAAPPQYFATVEDIMTNQADWEQKAIAWVPDHRDELNGPKRASALASLVQNIGITQIMGRHGVTPAKLAPCLDSKPTQDILEKTTNDAWNVRKISGTPGFMLNDTLQPDIHDWKTLEPAIQAALKG